MSLISEQVKELRDVAEYGATFDVVKKTLLEAADTIEALSAKLSAANMERSERYYGGGWVSVNDRLPEEDESVLVSFEEWSGKTAFLNDDGEWIESSTGNPILDFVTAWQYLPPKYNPNEDTINVTEKAKAD